MFIVSNLNNNTTGTGWKLIAPSVNAHTTRDHILQSYIQQSPNWMYVYLHMCHRAHGSLFYCGKDHRQIYFWPHVDWKTGRTKKKKSLENLLHISTTHLNPPGSWTSKSVCVGELGLVHPNTYLLSKHSSSVARTPAQDTYWSMTGLDELRP